MITAICQECKKQFEYDLKPGYPRKYCPECSAIKKASYENKQPLEVPVVRPGEPSVQGTDNRTDKEIKKPTGEYQSLVYNKTLCANSYEVGSAGNRFKIYFEDVKELQAKLKELKDVGLMMSEGEEFK